MIAASGALVPEAPSVPTGTGDGDTSPVGESVRSLGLGTSVSIIGTILLFGFNFVGRVAAARELSVSNWGLFNLGLSLTGLLSTVSLLGLAQATARTLAFETDEAERRAVLRWVIGAVSGIAIVTSLVVYFLASGFASLFHDPALIGVFQLLAVTVGFTVLSTELAAIFQGFRDAFPRALFNQVLNPGLFVVFVAAFYFLRAGLTGVLIASVASNGGAFVGLVVYARHRLSRQGLWTGPRHSRPKPALWQLSVALWGITSLAYVTAFADTLILGVYRSSVEVGYYSAAMNLARIVLLGGSTVTFIFLPIAAMLERRGAYDELRSIFLTASRWLVMITFPFFVMFVFAPDFTIEATFGSRYGLGAPALVILGISAFFAGALGPINASLTGLAAARIQLATSTTSAVVNIVLSFALIPLFGLIGAALAWGVARALYPTLGWAALYHRHRLTSFRSPFLVPLGVSLALTAPVTYVVGALTPTHYVVVALFLFDLAVYMAAILVTRNVLPDDFLLVEYLERLLHRPLPRVRSILTRSMRRPPTSVEPS